MVLDKDVIWVQIYSNYILMTWRKHWILAIVILSDCMLFYPPLKKFLFVRDNNLGSVRPFVCPSFLPWLSVRINISNTNEYFFPILYTCIYYNPPMNPVKCRQDPTQNGRLIAILYAQIDKIFQNGRLIAILFAQNRQIIWKCCLLG